MMEWSKFAETALTQCGLLTVASLAFAVYQTIRLGKERDACDKYKQELLDRIDAMVGDLTIARWRKGLRVSAKP